MNIAHLLENLPQEWRVVPFGELMSESAFGPRFSGDLYAHDGNVATLRTTDMDEDGTISYNTMPLAKIDVARFQNHFLRQDDLVITRSGTCGIAGIFRGFDKPVLPGAFLIRLRLREQADVRFFRYFFNSQPGRSHLLSIAAGAVQQNINITNLEKLAVPLPPLRVQHRIAGILSAYDDLIENSQRRIKILESMARALYREWFVHFRFPGHEGHSRAASPIGEIPQGWEVKKLSQIAENFDRLRKPLSKMERAQMQGEFPYYGAAKVFDYVNDFIFDGEYLLMAEDGSVITPERTPVLQLVNEKFWANNHTHILRGKPPISTHFLYLGLSDVNVSPYITGAAQPKITQENMNRIPFFCGPLKLHEDFNRLVEPMIRQSQTFRRQLQGLRRTRDLLLPRLLSGQLQVGAV